jgi:hypothetical protein
MLVELDSFQDALIELFSLKQVPKALWSLGKLNHVAIAVPNLKQATDMYKNVLQAEHVSEAVALPDHGVYTVESYIYGNLF